MRTRSGPAPVPCMLPHERLLPQGRLRRAPAVTGVHLQNWCNWSRSWFLDPSSCLLTLPMISIWAQGHIWSWQAKTEYEKGEDPITSVNGLLCLFCFLFHSAREHGDWKHQETGSNAGHWCRPVERACMNTVKAVGEAAETQTTYSHRKSLHKPAPREMSGWMKS